MGDTYFVLSLYSVPPTKSASTYQDSMNQYHYKHSPFDIRWGVHEEMLHYEPHYGAVLV